MGTSDPAAAVNAANEDDETALHLAAGNGDRACVDLLLQVTCCGCVVCVNARVLCLRVVLGVVTYRVQLDIISPLVCVLLSLFLFHFFSLFLSFFSRSQV